MPAATEDYVLGIHEAEIARLGLQHRVWRESMLGAWLRAGLGAGWRVVDLGAGPGYATWDLADLVGPLGRFWRWSERAHSLPTSRRALVWVASFVSSVPALVRPLVFAARAGEPAWQWPAAFVATNAARLHGLGRVSAEWVEEVGQELPAARSRQPHGHADGAGGGGKEGVGGQGSGVRDSPGRAVPGDGAARSGGQQWRRGVAIQSPPN